MCKSGDVGLEPRFGACSGWLRAELPLKKGALVSDKNERASWGWFYDFFAPPLICFTFTAEYAECMRFYLFTV